MTKRFVKPDMDDPRDVKDKANEMFKSLKRDADIAKAAKAKAAKKPKRL